MTKFKDYKGEVPFDKETGEFVTYPQDYVYRTGKRGLEWKSNFQFPDVLQYSQSIVLRAGTYIELKSVMTNRLYRMRIVWFDKLITQVECRGTGIFDHTWTFEKPSAYYYLIPVLK